MRLLLACMLLCGCGDAASAKIRLIPNVVAGTQALKGAAGSKTGAQESAIRIGSPGATNLSSLKYYIQSIQLCQDVDVMGSGYSSARGCIQLYQDSAGSPADYENYLVTQAEHDTTPGRFIDLMSADGQATLRRPVSLEVAVADPKTGNADAGASQAGAYRFGLINFYRPIKVKAEFPIVGQPGQYFRTKAVTHITTERTPDGRNNTERVQIGDTLSGETEETTYLLNNGGALFTFQKPFAITQADIDAQAEIKVDLVFNPENFGQAYETDDCVDRPDAAICDPLNSVTIDMPYVRMNPVPRKAGDKTHKETYLVDYAPSAKLRVELYYNDSDDEASVQGVDAAIVYDATATMPSNNNVQSNFVSQTGHVSSGDASVTLLDWQHTPTLAGLLRRQNGTASINCVSTGSVCPSSGTTIDRAYIYVGDTLVSLD